MLPLPPPGHGLPQAGRFIGFATDADSRQAIAMAAAARGWAALDVKEGGLEAAHAFLSCEPPPAFLVIDLSAARAPLPAVDALADVCAAETRVLAIGTQNDVELFRGLLALGVGDYLLKPVDMQEIGAALDRMMDLPPDGHDRAGGGARQATVAAFIGSRGGAGATALAAATASCLAGSGQRVVLIDLDLQGGSLALDLASDPSPALLQILESPDRVDPVVVEQALRPHPLGFRLLAVDAPIEAVPMMEGDALMALVAATMDMADIVVLDCPRWLDRMRRAVLRMVDRVVIVTPPTLPGLRDTRRVARLMQSLRAGQQPLLVGNRVGASAAELSRADFEQGLGQALDFWLPEEAAAARRAAERGLTLGQGASRRFSAELHRLADSLVPHKAHEAETPSLLRQVGRLFGRGSGR